jgi:hypothetical protein
MKNISSLPPSKTCGGQSQQGSVQHSFYKALKKLAEDIFACLLQPDYETNLYLYERRIHISKIKCISLIQKNTKNNEDMSRLLSIYNGLIDCGLLRWRIKDKSEFAICRDELVDIRNALVAFLSSRDVPAESESEQLPLSSRDVPAESESEQLPLSSRGVSAGSMSEQPHHFLAKQISALESIYQSILQITAKEPLPFLLFIYSLKTLKESCVAIARIASS